MAPRVSPALIGDQEAQRAQNTKLYSGELRAWQKPGQLTPRQRFDFVPLSIFRSTGADGSPLYYAWDKDVDVVKGPLSDTKDYRIYYTGDGTPKKTNTQIASVGKPAPYPADYLELAVPTPSVKPSVNLIASTGVTPTFATEIDSYTAAADSFSLSLVGASHTASCELAVGTRVITTTASQAITVGQRVTGSGMQADTFVVAQTTDLNDATKVIITLTKNAVGSGSQSLTFKNDDATRTTNITRKSGDDYVRTNALPAETRSYIYTYISVFGDVEEESAPSSVSDLITVRFGQTVELSSFAAPPSGKYNIQYIRIYRSVVGSSGSSAFLYVGEIPVNTATFVDNIKASGLGEVCPSLSYSEPPPDLKGLVGLANGVMAGFVENRLYFSEPFAPHAFPISYMLTTEYKIVGLGVFGESLAVMTEGNPYIVTGTDPASMSMSKLPLYEPCVSKRSIASDETGVQYASPNGLVLIGGGGAQNSTRNMFTRNEWQYYEPSSMLGRMVDGKYIGFYETLDQPVRRGAIILDRYISNSPLTECSFFATAAYVEPTQSSMFMAIDSEIKEWEGDLLNSLPYEWLSKLFILPRPLNFGAVQVDADFGDIGSAELLQERIEEIKAQNQAAWGSGDLLGALNTTPIHTYTVNGSRLLDISIAVDDRYVTLTVIADGNVRSVLRVQNRNAIRLPSGFKSDRWEFKINGNVPLKHIKVAETSKGLVEL